MTWVGFSLVFASVSLSALGQTAFKAGVDRVVFTAEAGLVARMAALVFSPLVLAGLALYGVGTVFWLFALRQMDLSLAYPFVAMSFVMVAGAGVFILGESVQSARVVGLALIVLGLLVMARGG